MAPPTANGTDGARPRPRHTSPPSSYLCRGCSGCRSGCSSAGCVHTSWPPQRTQPDGNGSRLPPAWPKRCDLAQGVERSMAPSRCDRHRFLPSYPVPIAAQRPLTEQIQMILAHELRTSGVTTSSSIFSRPGRRRSSSYHPPSGGCRVASHRARELLRRHGRGRLRNPLQYARALTASKNCVSIPPAFIAAMGGSLLCRIRVLMASARADHPWPSRWAAAPAPHSLVPCWPRRRCRSWPRQQRRSEVSPSPRPPDQSRPRRAERPTTPGQRHVDSDNEYDQGTGPPCRPFAWRPRRPRSTGAGGLSTPPTPPPADLARAPARRVHQFLGRRPASPPESLQSCGRIAPGPAVVAPGRGNRLSMVRARRRGRNLSDRGPSRTRCSSVQHTYHPDSI